jgi:hypothetical protein
LKKKYYSVRYLANDGAVRTTHVWAIDKVDAWNEANNNDSGGSDGICSIIDVSEG